MNISEFIGQALEEYRRGRLSRPDMMKMLGFTNRDELDSILKAHAVTEDLPTLDDLEAERQDLQQLGLT